MEITYERGGEFLGDDFKNSLIEQEYGIKKNLLPEGIHRQTQPQKEYIKYQGILYVPIIHREKM